MRSYLPSPGTGVVVSLDGPDADMLQELTIVRLSPGETIEDGQTRERVYLLMHGRVSFTADRGTETASRTSLFDEAPWAFHVCGGVAVTVKAEGPAELAVLRTENPRDFPTRLWRPEECRSEMRGQGTLAETATRIVRTIFDDTNAPASNLVVGEVVTPPGRWSSYPPHHHPQPEIYHYRFLPEGGFGLAAVGDQVYRVRSGDSTLIRRGQVHPQAAAPGYAMWYLWSVRHLEGDRYTTPVFQPEHHWTTQTDTATRTPQPTEPGGKT